MCTEAEGYKLIAIVISTQLQPTLKLSCITGKRERNTTTNGEFPGFYHCVKTLSFCNHCLSCKIAQMQQNPDAKCFFKHQLSDSKEQDEALRHYWSFQQAAIPGGTSNLSVGVPFIAWGERLLWGFREAARMSWERQRGELMLCHGNQALLHDGYSLPWSEFMVSETQWTLKLFILWQTPTKESGKDLDQNTSWGETYILGREDTCSNYVHREGTSPWWQVRAPASCERNFLLRFYRFSLWFSYTRLDSSYYSVNYLKF